MAPLMWLAPPFQQDPDVVGAPPELMFNMLLASGVLLGTVIVVVIVAIVWYRREERKRLP